MVWHSEEIYRGFLRNCFCCCGYIFRKINWHILSGFFPLVFAISLAMVKTVVKNVFWRVFFFFQIWPALFIFFCLIHLPATYYGWVLFLKQKVVHCVLSFWLVCVMLKSYIPMLFQYFWISSQTKLDVTYHCMQILKLVWTKNSMSSHSVRFPMGYWTWVVKYTANYFGWKITKKVLKLTKLMTQIPKFRLIYKKVTKSLFSFPVYCGVESRAS